MADEASGGVNFKTGRSGAPQVLALARDHTSRQSCRARRGNTGSSASNIGDGIHNLVEEKCAADLEATVEPIHGDACFSAGQLLSGESLVCFGEDVALAELSVELIQSGCAEGAVERGVPRDVCIDLIAQREPRAECVVRAIRKICGDRWAWADERRAHGGGIEVAPVVKSRACGEQPTRRNLDQVFNKHADGTLAPAGGEIRDMFSGNRRKKILVAAANLLVLVESGHECLPFSYCLQPERRAADSLRGNRLNVRERFAVAPGRSYSRKILVITLCVAIEAERERAGASEREVCPERPLPEAGGIGLNRCAILER